LKTYYYYYYYYYKSGTKYKWVKQWCRMKRSCLSKLKTNNVANKYVPKVLNEKAKTSNFYFTPSEKLCL